jgi:hypothetical protein
MAIVKEGQLNIDTFNTDAGGYKSSDVATYQGKLYTDKAIGSSVLGAIVYYPIYTVLHLTGTELSVAAEKHLLTFLIMGLPSAWIGTLLYMICEYLSKSRIRAFLVTIAITLGTMYFPFSIVFFGHQLAASLLFGAFYLIFRIKTLPAPQHINHFYTFLIGLLMGLAILTDMTTAVAVLPLIVYYFYVLGSKKLLKQAAVWITPALGGLIPILLLCGYNFLVYDDPFSVGYQYLVDETFKNAMANGLMGIGRPRLRILFYETLHPAQGLFWQSPVLLMAAVGGFFMLREKQFWAELTLAFIVCSAYLLMNSGYFMWWGGWSFGIRQIVPMLPFLCLPLIFVPKKFYPLMIGLTAISVIQMGIVSASIIEVPEDALLHMAQLRFFEYSSIYSSCLKALAQGNFAWNIGQAWLGLKQWSSLIPIILLIASTAFLFFRMKEDQITH